MYIYIYTQVDFTVGFGEPEYANAWQPITDEISRLQLRT